jgi:uncharacterized protein with von Willebrand factor type A (vWA) domain
VSPISFAMPSSALPSAEPRAERLSVAFARVLRGAGLPVPLDSVLTFTAALGEVGLEHRDDVYWAARATLVRRPEDVGIFDRAFAAFWDRREHLIEGAPEETVRLTLAIDEGEDGSDDDESATGSDEPTITLRWSAAEVLRHRDFALYTADELDEAQRLMADLRLAGSPRRSRRLVASRRPSGRLDLRNTVRAALRTEGEPMATLRRAPGTRPRRLILLLDVSGSMEPYARALLRFVHAAVAGRQKVEAFALGTRLTRITKELSTHDPDVALSQTGGRVPDWSGGTRLGESLRRFNDEWGVRGLARGAIVVVLSDGWDRGDPAVLGEQMARLSRVAHRLVWVNPLKVTPGYAPLARGMAAALPYVDEFVEGHSLAAMQELARVISAP